MAGRGWLVVLLPAGFVFGIIGGFMAEHTVLLGSVDVPWGALLVVVSLVVTLRALSLSLRTRLAGSLYFAGWLIATLFLALPNPSGDVVFSGTLAGYGYLLGGALLGAAAAAWPLFLDRPEPDVVHADA